ncbi:MAG: 5'-nucleotidase [Bacteroidia bacterium]|nr:5'-nucleotidase [Bacteroidia bacterium]
MKKILIISVVLVTAAQAAGAFGFKWKSIPVNAERTGVTAPTATNVDAAVGTFDGKTYVAPNGVRFKKNTATAKAARLMIDAQPPMAELKEVLGYCPEGLSRRGIESTLGNWVVDCVMYETEKELGKKVDIGIMNHGGIRIDMPQGDVLKDDIMSMLPFNNHLCYLTMSGENVLALFNSMASYMQVVGGVKVTVKDGKVQELLIGGKPVDPAGTYSIATIDFLLDGGDDIFVARNSESLEMTEMLVYEAAMAYIRELKASGKNIEKEIENRVVEL